MDKQEQAEFLIEAMPYIKKYFNKILVVKYGGNAMTDEKIKRCLELLQTGAADVRQRI